MKTVKVGTVAINTTPLDWKGNFSLIEDAIKKAKEDAQKLICFPELCITGYGCEDLFFSVDVTDRAWEYLLKITPLTKNIVTFVGLPIRYLNNLYNAVACVADGKIIGIVPKRFLANDGVHYEMRWFKPWPQKVVVEYKDKIPLGDLYFSFDSIRVGVEICEDAWVPERPGGALSRKGIDIIVNPSATHFAFGKIQTRRRYALESSRANGCTYMLSNIVGCEAGKIIYDGHTLISSNGEYLAEGEILSFKSTVITGAVVDIDSQRLRQVVRGSTLPEIEEKEERCIDSSFSLVDKKPLTKVISDLPKFSTEEEFTKAATLGLFDYLRKSRSKGYTISLSGGADSCAVTTLSYLALWRAWNEVSAKELENIFNRESIGSFKELVKASITAVYQGTENSSDDTRSSASMLANYLGVNFKDISVDSFVSMYRKFAEDVCDKKLSWDKDDLALQNVQARVRSPGIWLVANIKNALLLSCGNRSEASVGYMTMDGDTSGGVSPIAGVSKHFIRSWLKWIENNSFAGCDPIKGVSSVNKLEPSAELRPIEAHQTDEKDLMPYEVLDFIERCAVNEKRSPKETLEITSSFFEKKFSEEQLKNWCTKFYRLLAQSQWKRERVAPSFHFDSYSVDPRSWYRFPILSGGFTEEISDLNK